MNIHEVAVKLGLSYTSNKEAEFKLAEFISKKFQEAAGLFIKYNFQFKSQQKKRFRSFLLEVWKDNDGSKQFYLDDPLFKEFFPDLCGKDKPIEIGQAIAFGNSFAETYHYNGKYKGMYIATGIIDESKDVYEFKKAFNMVIASVYHECDHIYLEAECADVDNFETALLYYMDVAEIRAHSKELAFFYHCEVPMKEFNYKLLKKHIEDRFKPSESPFKIIRYLELMRDPKHFIAPSQEITGYIKNRILTGGHTINVDNLKRSFKSYIVYITFFVKYFNEHPEHKIAIDFNVK